MQHPARLLRRGTCHESSASDLRGEQGSLWSGFVGWRAAGRLCRWSLSRPPAADPLAAFGLRPFGDGPTRRAARHRKTGPGSGRDAGVACAGAAACRAHSRIGCGAPAGGGDAPGRRRLRRWPGAHRGEIGTSVRPISPAWRIGRPRGGPQPCPTTRPAAPTRGSVVPGRPHRRPPRRIRRPGQARGAPQPTAGSCQGTRWPCRLPCEGDCCPAVRP
jgi:hypothetical protein